MNATTAIPAPMTPTTFPGGKPIIGVLPQVQADPLGLMERATLEFGPVTHVPVPTTSAVRPGR